MKKTLFLSLLLLAGPLPASDLNGSFTTWGGFQRFEGADPHGLYRLRLLLGHQREWSPEWTSEVGLLAAIAGAKDPGRPSSSDDGEDGLLDASRSQTGHGRDWRMLSSIRLQRARVGYQKGPWQVDVGRVAMAWGESHAVRPTCVFHPPRLLETFADPLVGSDGVDASYALGSNTSLEGAVRALRGGEVETVVRVENRGIGVSGTPLFVHRRDGNGVGVECSATLKHFQWRWEGTAWRPGHGASDYIEWVTGLASVWKDFTYGAEFVRDGAGRMLAGGRPCNHVVWYWETPEVYRFRFSPTVVKPLTGKAWLLRPSIRYEVTRRLRVSVDGRWLFADASGPFAGIPTEMGASLTVGW